MKYAIICSTQDPASMNIRDNLLTNFDFVETEDKFDLYPIHEFVPKEELFEKKSLFFDNNIRLYTTDKQLIVFENIDKKINADLFIFASKHQSTSKVPSLTCHSIGNFDLALYGGVSSKLVKSNPFFLRSMYLELSKYGKGLSSFDIINEATHHGPYLDKVGVFVEIGSTTKEWENKKAGEILAKSIIGAIKNYSEDCLVAIGLGGLHSCNEFNKVILSTNVAFSFICPKHSLDFIDEDMLSAMIDKTTKKVDVIILDYKGLGKNKENIIALLEKTKIKYMKSSDIRNS